MTPFACELVFWRRQLAQICALADPRCKKGAKQASQGSTNWSKTRQNKESLPGKCPEETQCKKKSARTLREAAKTQGKTIDGPQKMGLRKKQDGPRKHKMGLRKNTRGATNDFPYADMETYRVQEYVHAHCLQMVSWFLVSWFQSFLVSWSQNFKDSMIP